MPQSLKHAFRDTSSTLPTAPPAKMPIPSPSTVLTQLSTLPALLDHTSTQLQTSVLTAPQSRVTGSLVPPTLLLLAVFLDTSSTHPIVQLAKMPIPTLSTAPVRLFTLPALLALTLTPLLDSVLSVLRCRATGLLVLPTRLL